MHFTQPDRDAIDVLAKAFVDAVPKGTKEKVMFIAALMFICASAMESEDKEMVSSLMHDAADELLKPTGAFALHR